LPGAALFLFAQGSIAYLAATGCLLEASAVGDLPGGDIDVLSARDQEKIISARAMKLQCSQGTGRQR